MSAILCLSLCLALAPWAVAAPGDEPKRGAESARADVSFDDALARIAAMRALLRDRLLVPDPQATGAHAALLSRLDGGVARILERHRFDRPDEPLGVRGGGCYYSFTRRDHSYDAEPEIGLEQGSFRSGFSGGNDGWVIALGDVTIESLTADPAAAPPGVTVSKARAWAMLLSPIDGSSREGTRAVSKELRDLRFDGSAVAQSEETYLVRSVDVRDGADVAVVFRVLSVDTDGVTLAWRLLRVFRAASATEARPDPLARVVPSELSDDDRKKSTDALLDEHAALVRSIVERAFIVEPDAVANAREAAGSPTAHVGRILRRPEFVGISTNSFGGAGLSLLEDDGHGGEKDDLRMSESSFVAEPAGSYSRILDVGTVSVDAVEGADATVLGLDGRAASVFTLLRDHVVDPEDPKRRASAFQADIVSKRLFETGDVFVPAIPGHTYVVRSIVNADRDLIAAFHYVGDDEIGAIVAWRVLKTWKVRKDR